MIALLTTLLLVVALSTPPEVEWKRDALWVLWSFVVFGCVAYITRPRG